MTVAMEGAHSDLRLRYYCHVMQRNVAGMSYRARSSSYRATLLLMAESHLTRTTQDADHKSSRQQDSRELQSQRSAALEKSKDQSTRAQ